MDVHSLLFDLIPDDLICIMLNYLDRKNFYEISKISSQFERVWNKYPLESWRKRIYYQTGLRTNQFDLPKLKELSRFSCSRHIIMSQQRIYLVNDYGQVYSCGDNYLRNKDLVPRLILENIIFVSCFLNHTLALTNNGKVYSFGFNDQRELGYFDDFQSGVPKLIDIPDYIVGIATGGNHSLLLTSNGQVYGFGSNYFGQLGIDLTYIESKPVIIGLDNIVSIAAGKRHSLALSSTGEVYGWGCNRNNQLNNYYGYNDPTIISGDLTNVVQIAAGEYSSAFLTSDGKVYFMGGIGMGNNYITHKFKVLPFKYTNQYITQISIGSELLAITNEGTIFHSTQYHENELIPKIYADPNTSLHIIKDMIIDNGIEISTNEISQRNNLLVFTSDKQIIGMGNIIREILKIPILSYNASVPDNIPILSNVFN